MPTVFNFNLDSPTTMEAEDGHVISSGGETSSHPIPIPVCSNLLLAPAAFDSDGLTPSPMSISDQHFSDAQGIQFVQLFMRTGSRTLVGLTQIWGVSGGRLLLLPTAQQDLVNQTQVGNHQDPL